MWQHSRLRWAHAAHHQHHQLHQCNPARRSSAHAQTLPLSSRRARPDLCCAREARPCKQLNPQLHFYYRRRARSRPSGSWGWQDFEGRGRISDAKVQSFLYANTRVHMPNIMQHTGTPWCSRTGCRSSSKLAKPKRSSPPDRWRKSARVKCGGDDGLHRPRYRLCQLLAHHHQGYAKWCSPVQPEPPQLWPSPRLYERREGPTRR